MALATSAEGRSRARAGTLGRRERTWGLVFLAPWIAGFLMFFAIPMALSFFWSFTEYNLISPDPPRFVGLRNWANLPNDPAVRHAVGVTLRFMLISVPLGLALPMLFAVLVKDRKSVV